VFLIHQFILCPLSVNTFTRAVAQLPLPITPILKDLSMKKNNCLGTE
jgi:hypothetical protein